MSNLLPDELKNKIKSEYRLRRFITILYFILFIQVVFIVFILPSWLTSFYREKDLILQSDKMNNSISVLSASSTKSIIKSVNQKVGVINATLEYKELVPVINTVLTNKSRYIKINQFAYKSNTASSSIMIIQGVSATRESLSDFIKGLEDTHSFKKIDSPISNFTKDRDIKFSITMTIGS